MNIKKFGQLNEIGNPIKMELMDETSENEEKALEAGYNIGDRVLNMTMNQILTIVKDSKDVTSSNGKCTLGAVGENLPHYKLVPKNSVDRPFEMRKLSAETNLKNTIDLIMRNSYYSKSQLEKIISEYLEQY